MSRKLLVVDRHFVITLIVSLIVSANTTNIFKDILDKFWVNQDILYDFKAQLHGTGSRSRCRKTSKKTTTTSRSQQVYEV